MKKVIILGLAVAIMFSSCGMAYEQSVKNFKSDLGGGLDRKITVSNTRTGEVLFSFDGKAYIDDSSIPGNVTIVCTVDGKTKKVDFIGMDYGVFSVEK